MMSDRKVKPTSMSLSPYSVELLEKLSSATGRTRSQVLERIVINASYNTLLRYARITPNYEKFKGDSCNGNN